MASCKNVTLVSGVLMMLFLATAMAAIECPAAFSTVADPSDCRNYVQCVFGEPVSMPCPRGLGYSENIKSCVYLKNSDCQDEGNAMPTKKTGFKPSSLLIPSTKPTAMTKTDAKTTTTQPTVPTVNTTQRDRPVALQRTIEEECERNPRARFPHPTECAQYYDCSVIYKNIPKYYEQFLAECPYPELFSDRTNRCESFNRVKCGRRREVKEPCDYVQNFCQTANCRPCHARFPSCGNQPDGINAWGEREWTPYFVQCTEGRLTDQGICEHNKGYPALFSPESKACVSIFTVPKKFGGYQPDCNRKRNGFYPDENGKCHVYFQCKSNEYRDTFECFGGRVFDPDTSLCKYPSEVRGKCRRSQG